MRGRKGAFLFLIVLAVAIMGTYMVAFQESEDEQAFGPAEVNESETAQAETAGDNEGENTRQLKGLGDDVEDKTYLDKSIQNTKHLQDRRKKIIDGMIEGGLASRIEDPGGKPFVYVLQPFYGLELHEQSSLLNVIWSYYITENRESEILTVYDDGTGNEIGTYGQDGLKLITSDEGG